MLVDRDFADFLFFFYRVGGDFQGEHAIDVVGVDVLFRGIPHIECAGRLAIEAFLSIEVNALFLDVFTADFHREVAVFQGDVDVVFLNARHLDIDVVVFFVLGDVGPHREGRGTGRGGLIKEMEEKRVEEGIFVGG